METGSIRAETSARLAISHNEPFSSQRRHPSPEEGRPAKDDRLRVMEHHLGYGTVTSYPLWDGVCCRTRDPVISQSVSKCQRYVLVSLHGPSHMAADRISSGVVCGGSRSIRPLKANGETLYRRPTPARVSDASSPPVSAVSVLEHSFQDDPFRPSVLIVLFVFKFMPQRKSNSPTARVWRWR